jgi:hypothetical protein
MSDNSLDYVHIHVQLAEHSVASGWADARSVAGSVGGVVWAAVALFAITLLVIALAGVTMSR